MYVVAVVLLAARLLGVEAYVLRAAWVGAAFYFCFTALRRV